MSKIATQNIRLSIYLVVTMLNVNFDVDFFPSVYLNIQLYYEFLGEESFIYLVSYIVLYFLHLKLFNFYKISKHVYCTMSV